MPKILMEKVLFFILLFFVDKPVICGKLNHEIAGFFDTKEKRWPIQRKWTKQQGNSSDKII